jgi:DNA-binding NtrC family response regulator
MEAIKLAKQMLNGIDIVITDVTMRGLSGGEVVAKLKLSTPRLRVIHVRTYGRCDRATRGFKREVIIFAKALFIFGSPRSPA